MSVVERGRWKNSKDEAEITRRAECGVCWPSLYKYEAMDVPGRDIIGEKPEISGSSCAVLRFDRIGPHVFHVLGNFDIAKLWKSKDTRSNSKWHKAVFGGLVRSFGKQPVPPIGDNEQGVVLEHRQS